MQAWVTLKNKHMYTISNIKTNMLQMLTILLCPECKYVGNLAFLLQRI